MLIKSEKNLVPTATPAHSVVIEDDLRNPIFVAVHLADGIMYSSVGDKDFEKALQFAGIETGAPRVIDIANKK